MPAATASGMLDSVSETWSDFDGNSVYGDYTVVQDYGDPLPPAYAVESRSYHPGIGKFAWDAGAPDITTLKHYHTDMIGTTRSMTDNGGAGTAAGTFTAFGQRISGSARRYGYAGAWGYQTATSDTSGDAYATDFKFMHVGARYYDPAAGRFLQRDPIGIWGGLNVYDYMGSSPTNGVDPSGLLPHGALEMGAVWTGDYRLTGSVDEATELTGDWAFTTGCVEVVAALVLPIITEAIAGLLPKVRPYPVGPVPDPSPDEPWCPSPDDHVVPSVPEDLPEGPLPPYNPDDYGHVG